MGPTRADNRRQIKQRWLRSLESSGFRAFYAVCAPGAHVSNGHAGRRRDLDEVLVHPAET